MTSISKTNKSERPTNKISDKNKAIPKIETLQVTKEIKKHCLDQQQPQTADNEERGIIQKSVQATDKYLKYQEDRKNSLSEDTSNDQKGFTQDRLSFSKLTGQDRYPRQNDNIESLCENPVIYHGSKTFSQLSRHPSKYAEAVKNEQDQAQNELQTPISPIEAIAFVSPLGSAPNFMNSFPDNMIKESTNNFRNNLMSENTPILERHINDRTVSMTSSVISIESKKDCESSKRPSLTTSQIQEPPFFEKIDEAQNVKIIINQDQEITEGDAVHYGLNLGQNCSCCEYSEIFSEPAIIPGMENRMMEFDEIIESPLDEPAELWPDKTKIILSAEKQGYDVEIREQDKSESFQLPKDSGVQEISESFAVATKNRKKIRGVNRHNSKVASPSALKEEISVAITTSAEKSLGSSEKKSNETSDRNDNNHV